MKFYSMWLLGCYEGLLSNCEKNVKAYPQDYAIIIYTHKQNHSKMNGDQMGTFAYVAYISDIPNKKRTNTNVSIRVPD